MLLLCLFETTVAIEVLAVQYTQKAKDNTRHLKIKCIIEWVYYIYNSKTSKSVVPAWNQMRSRKSGQVWSETTLIFFQTLCVDTSVETLLTL